MQVQLMWCYVQAAMTHCCEWHYIQPQEVHFDMQLYHSEFCSLGLNTLSWLSYVCHCMQGA